jgi:glycosyltransferase involved in cell wall biosynthesis
MNGAAGSEAEVRPLRVLYVTGSPFSSGDFVGGGEIHLVSLARCLNKEFFCAAATYPRPGAFSELLTQEGVKGFEVNTRDWLGLPAVWRLARLIRQQRIDIVQACDSRATLPAMAAGALTGRRCLFIVHLPHFPRALRLGARQRLVRGLRLLRDRVSSWLADRVIVISDEIEQEVLSRTRVAPRKVIKICNGVDEERFRAEAADGEAAAELRRSLGVGEREPVVGMLARLEPQKGHSFLFRAAAIVLMELPEVKFVVAGRGWYEPELRRQVEELGIGKSIVFAGFRDSRTLCALLDVKVFPSLDEGFGLAIAEAMLMGKPVVQSGIPAALVEHEVSGLLFPPGDVEALARTLLRLLRDEPLRRRLGQQARQVALKRYTLSRMVRQTEEVYLSLAGWGAEALQAAAGGGPRERREDAHWA